MTATDPVLPESLTSLASLTLADGVSPVDHLLVGVASLDRGLAWAERTFGPSGSKPALGGSHPGRGTRNALLSLGPSAAPAIYLEILALDPAQATGEGPLYEAVRDREDPTLFTWAARVRDLDARVAVARTRGLAISDPLPGSRVLPAAGGLRGEVQGRTLRWWTAHVDAEEVAREFGGLVPFLIEWEFDREETEAATEPPPPLHPAVTAPAAGTLLALDFEHPDPKALGRVLSALGLPAIPKLGTRSGTQAAPRARLRATVETAAGGVVTF